MDVQRFLKDWEICSGPNGSFGWAPSKRTHLFTADELRSIAAEVDKANGTVQVPYHNDGQSDYFVSFPVEPKEED